ncbi:putative membrane protein [Nonomuraea endophytica]|uniref:Putative membrane protein n=1 Tax=Nonomuraea endophytica TaxID=714136 RepID=A0A7W8EFH3_9ACTN|nr:putative membrane protein [Nonomuraea endophytica]
MLEHVLLSVHVLAAIVFVGGSAVATSLFPRYAPAPAGEGRSRSVAVALHRITRGYAAFGLVVPLAGMILAGVQGRMGEIWIIVSMVLTAAAALLLITQIYPRQRDALADRGEGDPARLRQLSMFAGIYNLAWAIVVVLMIVRPGSGQGA